MLFCFRRYPLKITTRKQVILSDFKSMNIKLLKKILYKIIVVTPCLFLLATTSLKAQVGIGTTTPSSKLEVVGVGTTSATTSLKVGNASSTVLSVRNDGLIEMSSTTQGFLPPRMTYAQREAIASPAIGLMVYCSNCGPGTGEPQYYNGSAWVNMIGGIALT